MTNNDVYTLEYKPRIRSKTVNKRLLDKCSWLKLKRNKR